MSAYYFYRYGYDATQNCELKIKYMTLNGKQFSIYILSQNLGASFNNGDGVTVDINKSQSVNPLIFENSIMQLGRTGSAFTSSSDIGGSNLSQITGTGGGRNLLLHKIGGISVSAVSYKASPLVFLFNEFDSKYIGVLYFDNIFIESSGGGRADFYDLDETAPTTASVMGYPNFTKALSSDQINATMRANLETFMANAYDPPNDPYSNAGDSDTGGGGGSWDDGSDPVNIPNLPSVGATNTGFISLFVPSQSQLKQVAEYMWGGLFDLSTYKRLFEDPMDCILGLSVVPVSVPTSGNANITVGNIELSGISLPVASQQYVAVDCGSLTVTPYFGSYLDYEPYTKMALFVPYSGVHTVNADDLMGRTVNLVYHIDILTGSLVAFLKCGDSVLYEFNGACSSNIPVNSINYASTIENAVRIAVNIGTTVATAGASAPLSAGAEGVSQGLAGAQNIARGVSLAGSTADGALSLKPNIDRAGSLGGTTGLLGNQTPYFIITRPRLCKPKDQNKIKGYPAFINYSVSDLVGKGYTEFDTILLQNLYLTDDEKNELESILKGGVYL